MRELLTILDVPEARMYRTQDLRRGHARDLQSAGATLAEIVAAGQWAPAWTKYVDMDALQDEAVAEAALFRRWRGMQVPDTRADKTSVEELDELCSDTSSEGDSIELG